MLGYIVEKDKKWLRKKGNFVTTYTNVPLPLNALHRELATKCYHGGRNECFWFGPTQPGEWYEHDLTKAYTTTVALLWLPDYEAARVTLDPADFRIDELGYARIRFQFPPETEFPVLYGAVPRPERPGVPARGRDVHHEPGDRPGALDGREDRGGAWGDRAVATGEMRDWRRPFLTTIQKLQDRSDARRRRATRSPRSCTRRSLTRSMANSPRG